MQDPYKEHLRTHVVQVQQYKIGRYVTFKAIASISNPNSILIANTFIYESTDTNNENREFLVSYIYFI